MVCKFDVLRHDSRAFDMGEKVVIFEVDNVVVREYILQCQSYRLQCRQASASGSEIMVISQT